MRLRVDLSTRLSKFGLSLHEDKTRLLEFGKFAKGKRLRSGHGVRKRLIFWGPPIIVVKLGMDDFWSNGKPSGTA